MFKPSQIAINTFDKTVLPLAKQLGFGLEIEDYLLTYSEAELREKHESVSEWMKGFTQLSFHGTAVSRDVASINRLTDDELLKIYNDSFGYAALHRIHKIVFHSNYLQGTASESQWITSKAAFWKRFLQDKPASVRIYLENFIDDTPEMLAQLCDAVNDPRFCICLDTGHACCNSKTPLHQWIQRLGKRIEHVHLHNNDGISDKHWPPGQGILDSAEILRQLLDLTNTETIVLECNLHESLRWLRQHQFLPLGL